MKIIACTRALNEERNIAHFCAGYDWADMVLVADGGSTDGTVEIANLFPNVWVREFAVRVPVGKGWMNPEPQHMNFTVEWAEEEGADWIIYDDADGWPNPALKRDARAILEGVKQPGVYLYRFYLWGQDEYFPKYNVNTSVWAWRPSVWHVRWEEATQFNFETHIHGLQSKKALHLEAPPYCLLHNFAPDEAAVQIKLERYAGWGFPQIHPLASIYAPPEALPEWVHA